MIEEKQLTEAQKNAKIALSNRLYVSGWCLNEDLHEILKSQNEKSVVELYYKDDVPVGVAVYHRSLIQVFVRAKFRRMGIGTKLINQVKRKVKKLDGHGTGVKGSDEFWKKVLQTA